MTHFDVFNGDADGIIALLQLRLAEPKESTLITGVKRDISLLKQVDGDKASSVTVLDISLEKNVAALTLLLDNKVDVFYADHHRTGDIPKSEHLKTLINLDANTCTSLIINDLLKGQHVLWAIAAAFGDNMTAAAVALCKEQGLTATEQNQLKDLGIYINYNGYGRDIDDLHFAPADLYKVLLNYPNPFDLINESGSAYAQLKAGYEQDMANAQSAEVCADNESCKVLQLADQPWAHRISGVYGNELANQSPDKAHAILTINNNGNYTVSVRAPLNNKQGADEVCSQFVSGGGRAGAAGVNDLPKEKVSEFINTLTDYYR